MTDKCPNHYDIPIQPVDFIHANGLDYFEGNAIKYICRHRVKGRAEDIRKAIHYLEMILEKDYGQVSEDKNIIVDGINAVGDTIKKIVTGK